MEDLPRYERWLSPGEEWQRWDGPDFDYGDPAWRNRHLESLRDEIAKGDAADPRRRLVIADRNTDGLIGAVSRYWIRKPQRLGVTEEARFRNACVVEGKYFDALGFGVLREEWERRGGLGASDAPPLPGI